MAMRLLLLLVAVTIAASAAAAETKGLRAFYCIHSERPCNETSEDIPVSAGDALVLARRALSTKDDFVGFTDADGTTLQFYVEEVDSILVDMPVPQQQGSWSTHVDRARALKLIAGLGPPLSRYRSSLKLQFEKWK
jgi:hypothetical protein